MYCRSKTSDQEAKVSDIEGVTHTSGVDYHPREPENLNIIHISLAGSAKLTPRPRFPYSIHIIATGKVLSNSRNARTGARILHLH